VSLSRYVSSVAGGIERTAVRSDACHHLNDAVVWAFAFVGISIALWTKNAARGNDHERNAAAPDRANDWRPTDGYFRGRHSHRCHGHRSACNRRLSPWGQPTGDALLLLATAYIIPFNIARNYVVALLAPERPMQHALVSGAAGVLACTVGAVTTWDRGPGSHWYPLALIVLAMPSAWAGGRLRAKQLRGRIDG